MKANIIAVNKPIDADIIYAEISKHPLGTVLKKASGNKIDVITPYGTYDKNLLSFLFTIFFLKITIGIIFIK